jgi:hypothetical protein
VASIFAHLLVDTVDSFECLRDCWICRVAVASDLFPSGCKAASTREHEATRFPLQRHTAPGPRGTKRQCPLPVLERPLSSFITSSRSLAHSSLALSRPQVRLGRSHALGIPWTMASSELVHKGLGALEGFSPVTSHYVRLELDSSRAARSALTLYRTGPLWTAVTRSSIPPTRRPCPLRRPGLFSNPRAIAAPRPSPSRVTHPANVAPHINVSSRRRQRCPTQRALSSSNSLS